METQSKGRLIVIEGLDGSGKGTQAKLLAKTLAEKGKRVREVSFPNYESDSWAWFSFEEARKNILPETLAGRFLNAYLDDVEKRGEI